MSSADQSPDRNLKPLKCVVELYLFICRLISLRARVFGVDPDHTPNYIKKRESWWFNRDCLVDVYAIVGPIAGAALLTLVGNCPTKLPYWGVALIGVLALYRLNELFSAV